MRALVALSLLMIVTVFCGHLLGGQAGSGAADKPRAQADRLATQPAVAAQQSPLSGIAGNARRIVFVCDASGSMIAKFPLLKGELDKAITGLHPVQSFSIIFFQDTDCDAFPKEKKLVAASPRNMSKAKEFIQGVTTTGTTDPIPGIERAFKLQPQTIYLLTDGDFPDNAAVLKKCRELNPNKKVKVNTIAFTGESDKDTDFIDLLKTIAKESGGTYRHVTVEEVEAGNEKESRASQ